MNPEQTLITLANHNPDFPHFVSSLPPNLPTTPIPPSLAEDILALQLAQDPQLSAWQSTPPTQQHKSPAAPAGILALAAMLFLLRSHVEFKGERFKIVHKPMGDAMLNNLVDKILNSDALKKTLDIINKLIDRDE